MKTSEQINEIAAALAKAQAQIKAALRDSENPYFNSKYADLASTWEACREALTKNSLAVVQGPALGEGGVVELVTRLVHSSGQWFESAMGATPKDLGPQAVGSTITYLRRYGLAAMVGIAPEDDDGNAASAGNGQPQDSGEAPFHYEAEGEQVDPRVAFRAGRTICPECKRNAIIKGKPEYGGGWVCFKKRGGCGKTWMDSPLTEAERAARVPKPVDKETGELLPDPAVAQVERQALLMKVTKLSDTLGFKGPERAAHWKTYCGTATEQNVDPAALQGLVAWLQTRAEAKGAA